MIKRIGLLGLVLVFSLNGFVLIGSERLHEESDLIVGENMVSGAISVPSHAAFDQLLQKYVTADGKVNYVGFKKEESALDTYIKSLAAASPQAAWSKNEQMAYWINLYNALTIQLICVHYPVTRITDIDKGKPWDATRVTIGGKGYSLNDIENNALRPMGDPRIHFAINCAALSCPPIWNHAWTGTNVSERLEMQAKRFINAAGYNKVTATQATLSSIFNWFGKDFGNVVDFLNKYSAVQLHKDAKIGYMEYDWLLNKQ